jgi:hypothetical protein
MRRSLLLAVAVACVADPIGASTPTNVGTAPDVPCNRALADWCPTCAVLPTVDDVVAGAVDPVTGQTRALWKRCVDPAALDAWQTVIVLADIGTRYYFDGSGALTATREWSDRPQCRYATGEPAFVLVYGTQPACAAWCEMSDPDGMSPDPPCE